MEILDYSRSYLSWDGPTNSVRILLDARARVIDERAGIDEEYFLIAPCRQEYMYRDSGLAHRPGGEYRLAFARDGSRSLRFSSKLTEPWPEPKPWPTDRFNRLEFLVTSAPGARRLETEAEIVAAAQTIDPVVAQTEIWNEARGRGAVLEYPVKTLNYLPDGSRFQVDAGPMLWVDLNSGARDPIEWIRLSHVIYNRFDKAEFVKRGPWPVMCAGEQVALVEDYQHIHEEPARHTFFAVSG